MDLVPNGILHVNVSDEVLSQAENFQYVFIQTSCIHLTYFTCFGFSFASFGTACNYVFLLVNEDKCLRGHTLRQRVCTMRGSPSSDADN